MPNVGMFDVVFWSYKGETEKHFRSQSSHPLLSLPAGTSSWHLSTSETFTSATPHSTATCATKTPAELRRRCWETPSAFGWGHWPPQVELCLCSGQSPYQSLAVSFPSSPAPNIWHSSTRPGNLAFCPEKGGGKKLWPSNGSSNLKTKIWNSFHGSEMVWNSPGPFLGAD